jgi:hypothetical protein
MKSPHSLWAALAVLVLVPFYAISAKEPSPEVIKCTAPLPRVRLGCSGEMCECRTGKSLLADAVLYKNHSVKSKVVTKLKAGTRFKSRDLSVVTLAYGMGEAESSEGKPLKIQIASYFGEGHYEFCGSIGTMEEDDIRITQEPKTEDWAKVATLKGETGWILTKTLRTTEGDNCDFDSAPK